MKLCFSRQIQRTQRWSRIFKPRRLYLYHSTILVFFNPSFWCFPWVLFENHEQDLSMHDKVGTIMLEETLKLKRLKLKKGEVNISLMFDFPSLIFVVKGTDTFLETVAMQLLL